MFSISVTQIAAGIGGIAWFVRIYITGDLRKQCWPLLIPFALFSLACIIAVIDAYDTSYAYKELRKLLEILIFFLGSQLRTRKSLKKTIYQYSLLQQQFLPVYMVFIKDGVMELIYQIVLKAQ